MPNNYMLLSSDAIDLLIIASLLIIEEFASSNYFFQAWYYFSVNIFWVKTKVLKPYLDKS